MLLVYIITAGIYRIYCVRHYHESHYQVKVDKEIAKDIMSFSIYNMLGNLGSVINTQGTSFVINIFFGVIYNAAASIALTVSGVVTGFASNIMTAFRPQIIKSYANNDIEQFQSLLSWAIKSILLVYSFVAIPAGFAIKEVLSIWLVDVPEYADVFCRLLLISIFFETCRYIIIIGIHATGRVKFVSLSTGILFCLNPFIVYLLFSFDLPPAYAYVSVIAVNIILAIIDMFILKYNERRFALTGLVFTLLRVMAAIAIVMLVSYFVCMYKTGKPFFDILIICFESCILLALCGYYGILNTLQRRQVRNSVKKKLIFAN